MGRPFTTIELDKVRSLRYGYKALITMEDMLGISISKLDFSNINMMDLAKILYAGLKHEDQGLKLDELIDILDEHGDINLISEKIGVAINEAFGKQKNEIAPAVTTEK